MKKTMSITMLILSIFVAILFITGCKPHTPEQRAEWIASKITKDLKLDKSQQELLKDIKDELLSKISKIRSEHESIHEVIVEQINSDSIDKEQIKSLVKERREKMDEMIGPVIDGFAELHVTFTPEQKAQLIEMTEKWKNHKHRKCDGWH